MSDAPASETVERVTRRTLLKALGGAATGAAILPAAATQAAKDSSATAEPRELTTPLHFSSATALAQAIRTKRLNTARPVVAALETKNVRRSMLLLPGFSGVEHDSFDRHRLAINRGDQVEGAAHSAAQS